ncbi:hypothetical protein [Actinomadura harenae]|uniref:hypothetical protein n=1 Tax=Actinomadura harenae TaxID=2483351 RepID=UPI0018F68BD2|nr:hypothetical protein [Actinomadura harenae]
MTGSAPPPDWQQRVDAHPAVDQPGHPDEQDILQRLYGPPDAAGIYRGEGPQ